MCGRISMAVGKAMYEVLGIERMNYEDLGNWGLDNPGGQVLRSKVAEILGEEKYSKMAVLAGI